jgi:ATP-binding cassette subfamily B protein
VWAATRNRLPSTSVWAQAIGPRVVIAQTTPAAGRGLAAALVVVNVLLGLFPLVFVLATSVVVGRVPAAVTAGLDSAEWESLVMAFLLAAAAFAGQQVISTVQGSLGELAKRRVDGRLREQTMDMTLSSTGVGAMKDSTMLDALSDATRSFDSDWPSASRAESGSAGSDSRIQARSGPSSRGSSSISRPAPRSRS